MHYQKIFQRPQNKTFEMVQQKRLIKKLRNENLKKNRNDKR